MDKFHAFIDHQRQVHNEERELWYLEKEELDARISRLEAMVHQYKERYGSIVLSPRELSKQLPHATSERFSTKSKPRSKSAGTGDEFWRGPGGQLDTQSTRTFSEPSDTSTKINGGRMPSIAEDENVQGQSGCNKRPGSLPKPIARITMDGNLDGITFKPTVLSPSVANNLMTPQSPSPLHSISPTRPPGLISLPYLEGLSARAFYTEDAGHTPLVRPSHISDDNTKISLSDSPTPICSEQERPPIEPRPSMIPTRQPAERSDSYFPVVVPTDSDQSLGQELGQHPDREQDEDIDPSLIAPLSLQNNASDASFLSELDSKLLQAARSEVFERSLSLPDRSQADVEGCDKGKADNKATDDSLGAEEPEAEPKLRIKRSMNFGSQLGSSRCGKGIV